MDASPTIPLLRPPGAIDPAMRKKEKFFRNSFKGTLSFQCAEKKVEFAEVMKGIYISLPV